MWGLRIPTRSGCPLRGGITDKAYALHAECKLVCLIFAGILNVSAEDKTTGNKNKITITNDKGKCSLRCHQDVAQLSCR